MKCLWDIICAFCRVLKGESHMEVIGKSLMDIWGESPTELKMVMKLVQLNTMSTSSVGSASGSWLRLSGLTLRACHFAPAMRLSLTVPRVFLLWPTTSIKVVFISTLMTFFAPCWTFSQWVGCAAFTACLTLGTLKVGSLAIAFPLLESVGLIYSHWCGNSTIWFVLVEVFHHHFMLLSLLEKSLIHDILSPLLQSDLPLGFKMFCCMDKQLCPIYHSLCFCLVLASLDYILDTLVKLVICLVFSLSDVSVHLIDMVPVRFGHF